jgi:ABC-2 type transport system permease protein
MSEGLPQRLPIGVIDLDNSTLSRNIIRKLDATQQTRITGRYLHFSEARTAMQKGEIFGFITIPKHLKVDVTSGLQPKIDFYCNQSYLIPGSLVLKNISTLLNTISAGAGLQIRLAKGQDPEASMAQIQPISPELHAIGNPYINYSIYLINVFLPGLLQLMVLLTTVYCIGIELKKKTSRKWLRTAGGSLFKSLLGKLLPYTVLFTGMAFAYDIFLYKIMHYPLNNSMGWMFLASFLLVLAAQSIAVLMIGILPVLKDGLSFSGLYGMLAFTCSGLSFPIEGMPGLMQGFSALFPMRWFFRIYQNIALNGSDPIYSLPYFALMLLFLLLPLFVWRRLKTAIAA